MGVFNFMETFFFISLGITFVLILLLVYHFKQRLGTIEQKGDTMFEIVNTMVREMSLIKSMVISQMRETPVYNPVNAPILSETQTVEFVHAPTSLANLNHDDKIAVSDDDDDDDDDEDDDEDEDDEDDEEDEEDEEKEDENVPSIKVINIPFSDNLTDTIEINEDEYNSEMDSEPIVESFDEDAPVLTVNKLSESESFTGDSEENKVLEEVTETKESKESEEVNYNKMSLYSLKNLVVSRGLATDSSKMKKPQLIQLLESSDKNL